MNGLVGAFNRANAYTDADMLSLPSHISLQHARDFARSTLAGDVDRSGMLSQPVKQLVDEIVPHND